MSKAELIGMVRIFMTVTALFLTAAFLAAGARQIANNGQKYSASLLTTQFAKDPKFFSFPDGRQQLTYTTENEYPADDVLSFLKAELKKQGWIPLAQDFLNPDIPSSNQRGWTFFEDQTQKPRQAAWKTCETARRELFHELTSPTDGW